MREYSEGQYNGSEYKIYNITSKGGFEFKTGTGKKFRITHEDWPEAYDDDIEKYFNDGIVLDDNQVITSEARRNDVKGTLVCDSLAMSSGQTFLSGKNYDSTMNPSFDGIVVLKTINTIHFYPYRTEAPDKIYVDGSSLTELLADQIVYIQGTKSIDGLWQIDSVGVGYIIIKSAPDYDHPLIKTSVTTEVLAGGQTGKLSIVSPGYFLYDFTSLSWKFGTFHSELGPQITLKLVGIKDDGLTTDFSDEIPNLKTQGSDANHSGASNIGLNVSGFSTITETTVQGAFGQIDTDLSVVKGDPEFTFGETNVGGALNKYVGSDSQIALFRDQAPSDLTVGGSASKGSSGKASRDDHIHGISAGTPVDVGLANFEGTATTFSRSDHVHKMDLLASSGMKSGSASVGGGISSLTVSFATPFPTSITSVVCTLESMTSMRDMFAILITEKDVNHFKVEFSYETYPLTDYKLNWIAIGN